jgi:hypothetical protein
VSYEELTPGVRMNYGHLISAKDDTPQCIRRRKTLMENPKFFEQHEYTEKDKAWFRNSIADENDMCACEPGCFGGVWGDIMSAMGPHDDWFTRTDRGREDDLAYFLEEAGYDAERYQRAMELRYS